MSGVNDLAKMVPGFEFLQNLMKGAGASLPGVQGFGQWVAPTLDPEELDKRIQELKTVQFWLEQNARLLGGTIQALEVQRMTLSTLQTMNLPLAELRNALQARAPAPPPPAAPAPRAAAAAIKEAEEAEEEVDEADEGADPAPKPAAAAPAAIDPMQWWGALTQQFTEIAAKAVKDSTANAAREVAGAAIKQGVQAGLDSAGKTLRKAAGLPARTAKAAVKVASKAAAPRKRKV